MELEGRLLMSSFAVRLVIEGERCKFLLVSWVGPADVGDQGEDSEFSYETRGRVYRVRATRLNCRRMRRLLSVATCRSPDGPSGSRSNLHLGSCDPLHRAVTHIAGGEESWHAGLERQRLTAE